MCGIAGIAGASDPGEALRSVTKMTDVLARRGPDGQGVRSWPGAVLGHRRLAIFDLSTAGDQPMLSRDGLVGIVFNGAIYNFHALRSELEKAGHEFRSRSDTEVLVEGYLEWGIDGLLERIRGMFAFALWDEQRGTLWLVRDRLGVKPLLFAQTNGSIAFASTVRALRAAGYGGELNERAVADYLRFGFVPDEVSIYRGIVKVPAATILEWSEDGVRRKLYWEPPAAREAGAISFADAVEQTERLLLDAVKTRLHADVPVGALLSGGIDSGLICWAIAKLGGDVTAFTVGTPGDRWDETGAARETARRLGIRHQVLEMTDAEPPDLSELVSAYSEPFACASALGMLRVSRAVARSAKVLLTGDGGDDVFLGYPRHRHLVLAANLAAALPYRLQKLWQSAGADVPRVGPFRRGAALFDYAVGGLDAYMGVGDGLAPYRELGLLGPRLRDAASSVPLPRPGTVAGDALREFLEYERRTHFVAEFMTKVDAATMYYGLEARAPFFDQRLWEFAASLPYPVRLRGYRLKAVLRALAARRIGRRIALRRKRGFGVPVGRWIARGWRAFAITALKDSRLVRNGLIRPEPLRSLFEGADARAAGPAWSLLVLESWLAHEEEGGSSLKAPDRARFVASGGGP